jgi:hypothetical protein
MLIKFLKICNGFLRWDKSTGLRRNNEVTMPENFQRKKTHFNFLDLHEPSL